MTDAIRQRHQRIAERAYRWLRRHPQPGSSPPPWENLNDAVRDFWINFADTFEDQIRLSVETGETLSVREIARWAFEEHCSRISSEREWRALGDDQQMWRSIARAFVHSLIEE